jgi:hypothetical protein
MAMAIHRIELRRKDNEPLCTWAEAITAWTPSLEDPHYTDVWIDGQKFTLGMPFEEVDQLLANYSTNDSSLRAGSR